MKVINSCVSHFIMFDYKHIQLQIIVYLVYVLHKRYEMILLYDFT